MSFVVLIVSIFSVFVAEHAQLYLEALKAKTGQTTVPNVFVNGQHIGGCDDTFRTHQENRLVSLITAARRKSNGTVTKGPDDYDFIVIGGGSGGLAASKVSQSESGKYLRLCH
jgi:thioredoxin reductase (NADPH)